MRSTRSRPTRTLTLGSGVALTVTETPLARRGRPERRYQVTETVTKEKTPPFASLRDPTRRASRALATAAGLARSIYSSAEALRRKEIGPGY